VSVPTDLVLSGPHPLRGRLRVPGDKGMSHRALLFAAMADGRSHVRGLAGGDDVSRTRGALAQLGVSSTVAGSAVTVAGHRVTGFTEPMGILDCGNSGTTIRLLSGLLAGRPFLSVLTGDDSLVRRPMARVVAPLRAMGARVDGRADGTLPPLTVRGGGLIGTSHSLTVASAQVKTALLLAGLQADGTTEISEPAPSRDHTERMLAALGAPIIRVDERAVRVTAGAPQPFDFDVPGDPSSAAFWVVAATITPGSELVVEDVALNPARIAFVDVLVRMGAAIEMVTTGERLGEPVGELRVRSAPLHGTTVEGVTIPWVIDEIPALAVAAAFADGVTEFRDAGELRVKESDRIATVGELLTRLGVGVESGADHLVVRGGKPAPAALDSHGDHRVAMAGAVAANALEGEMVVRGWRTVASSYPEFTEDLATLTGGAAR
jgi:3-phosphoshikimate 1-carboxyvinyltransferase